jgi:hypothetical protein
VLYANAPEILAANNIIKMATNFTALSIYL